MNKIINIKWKDSVWFFDVDDTLCNVSDVSTEATIGIALVLKTHFGEEISSKVQQLVNSYYSLMLAGARLGKDGDWFLVPGGKEAFNQLMDLVQDSQKEVTLKYGVVKRWSREVFVKLAADKLNIKITPELVHEAVDAYWMEITKRIKVYPDAVGLIKAIRNHNRPIYLLTSSDSRLKLQDNGQFSYDPAYSESLKRQRIEPLREKGIEFNVLSIGDPEDKPHLDFFEKGIKKAEEDLGKTVNLNQAIMVGDAFGNDLQTPKEKMGFGLVVLINRTRKHFEIIDEHQINTSNLDKVTELIL